MLLGAAEQPLPPVKPKSKSAPEAGGRSGRRSTIPQTQAPEPRPTKGLVLLVLLGLAGIGAAALLTRSPAPRENGSRESGESQPHFP
jgi:hypothetical protein